MTITCSAQTLQGSCGIGLVHGFRRAYPPPAAPQRRDLWAYPLPPVLRKPSQSGAGGAGWKVAAFVNDNVCKETYEELHAAHTIVFQSKPRRNNNSGRNFAFCVYDTKNGMGLDRPVWKGKRSGAQKPQALIDWEAKQAEIKPIDNSAYKWMF